MTLSVSPRDDRRGDGITPPHDTAALFDVVAVAALLSCSTRTVRRMADSGQMPRPVRISSLVRWRAESGDPMTGLRDWLAAGCPSCRPARGAGR